MEVPHTPTRSCFRGRNRPSLDQRLVVGHVAARRPNGKWLRSTFLVTVGEDGRGGWFGVSIVRLGKGVRSTTQGFVIGSEFRTLSKLTLMLPTFVAPTGTMPKKPYRQRPSNATRSLRTKRLANRLTRNGETENNSPTWCFSQLPTPWSCPRTRRTSKVSSSFNNPRSRTVEPMVISGSKVDDGEVKLVSWFDFPSGLSRQWWRRLGTQSSSDLGGFLEVVHRVVWSGGNILDSSGRIGSRDGAFLHCLCLWVFDSGMPKKLS